jgi:hypothetical protein
MKEIKRAMEMILNEIDAEEKIVSNSTTTANTSMISSEIRYIEGLNFAYGILANIGRGGKEYED